MRGRPSEVRVCSSPSSPVGKNSIVWITRGKRMNQCPKPRKYSPAVEYVLFSTSISRAL